MADDIYAILEHVSNNYGKTGYYLLPSEVLSKLKVSGITLFKYHTIAEILQRATPGLPTPDLELIAGSRWWHLDKKQEAYWREQTRLVLHGFLQPLECWLRLRRSCDITIENRLRKWHRQDRTRTEAACPDQSGRTEGVLVQLGHLGTTLVTRGRLGLSTRFDDTPQPWPRKQHPASDASDLSDDAADDALDRMQRPAIDAPDDGIEDVSAETVTISATPVLDFLLKDRAVISGDEDLRLYIQEILQAISTLQRGHSNMTLRGCRSGMRVNYIPGCKDVTGIAARLSAAAQPSSTANQATKGCKNLANHFEYLLRGLVFLNRSTNIFVGVYGPETWRQDGTNLSRFYDSLLYKIGASISPKWRACRPLGPSNKQQIVATLMECVRSHILKQAPNHELLIPASESLKRLTTSQGSGLQKRLGRWGVQTDTQGFAAHLLSCFDRVELTSDEYEDFLEQKLWSLNQFAPGIVWHTRSNTTRR